MAVAIPTPISFKKTWSPGTKAKKTAIMMAAAAVMMRAVAARPSATATALSPLRWYSSRMRDRRNTS